MKFLQRRKHYFPPWLLDFATVKIFSLRITCYLGKAMVVRVTGNGNFSMSGWEPALIHDQQSSSSILTKGFQFLNITDDTITGFQWLNLCICPLSFLKNVIAASKDTKTIYLCIYLIHTSTHLSIHSSSLFIYFLPTHL